MLWNALCDQAVEPSSLGARLRERNAYLAIGTHDFYEIAKNFARPKNHTRGRLYHYVAGVLQGAQQRRRG